MTVSVYRCKDFIGEPNVHITNTQVYIVPDENQVRRPDMSGCRLFFACRIPKTAISLGVAGLLALAGCSRLEVKLGSRVSLAQIPVASIEARQLRNPGIAPGEKSPMLVAITTADGKVMMTEGKGKGKVLWKDLAVTASVVSVNRSGTISLPKDPRVSDGQTGHVTITVPSHPGVRADLEIPLRYDFEYRANFSGASGMNGTSGTSGSDGSSGSSGSMDPTHPSAGGDGSNGSNGGDGGNGGDGQDGPPVEVRVALRPGSRPLLQVGVFAGRKDERYFLIDPAGGSLTVSTVGGSAGTAGKGGRGGRGGSGGIGTPSGSSGRDGLDGHDGRNGSDGGAGRITVTYDPRAKLYLHAIVLSSQRGPDPVFQEATVGPLW
jgi:hypothetical protein